MSVEYISGIVALFVSCITALIMISIFFVTDSYTKSLKEQKNVKHDDLFCFDHSPDITSSEAETILKIAKGLAKKLELNRENGDIIGFFVYPYGATEVKLLKYDDLKQAFRS